MLISVILTSLLASTNASAECVPARETVNHRHSGQYHRIHPSGNFALYSSGNGVKIVDFTNRSAPKEIDTPMRAETYPVESATGGWTLLASPYDKDGMNYYQMKDLLEKKAQAKSIYKDKDNDQYYHSTAELPGSTRDVKRIRTLLYGKQYREYTMSKDEQGNFTKVEPGPARQQICMSFVSPAVASLDTSLNAEDAAKRTAQQAEANRMQTQMDEWANRYRRLDYSRDAAERQQIEKDYTRVSNERDKLMAEINAATLGSRYLAMFKRTMEIGLKLATSAYDTNNGEFQRLHDELNQLSQQMAPYASNNSNYFSNPVLSKDGTLVAAAASNSLKVYKILPDAKCEEVANVPFATSKVSFSIPEKGKLPKITFTAQSGGSNNYGTNALVYDLNNGETTPVALRGTYGNYPGFTRDGRVIYSTGNTFEIVDPNQVNGTKESTCITKASVAAASAASEESDSGSAQ